MPTATPSTWFILIGIASNGLLSLIDWARGSKELWDAMPLVLGSGPNVVAVPAIVFTALGLALCPDYVRRVRRYRHTQLVWAFVAATVAGLIIWEVLQRGSTGLRFDWLDIAATLLSGGLCGLGAARLLRAERAVP